MSENAIPSAPLPVTPPPVEPQNKGLAITALVLGIIAIVGSWIPFVSIGSAIIGIVGIVIGIVAINKASKRLAGGKTMAVIGTVISGLAIVAAIISTSLGVMAINDVADEIDGNITAVTATAADDTESTATAENPDQTAAAADTIALGSFEAPGVVGDGTVWVIEDGGDEWNLVLDSIEMVTGYSGGQIAVLKGTATPTVISDGAMSSWVTFPSIGWIGGGASIDDTYDFPVDDISSEYRSTIDLEATAGTAMKFYSTVGLPEGVTPELITLSTMWGSDDIYISTGL